MRLLILSFLFMIFVGCNAIPTLDSIILRPSTEMYDDPNNYGYSFNEVTLPIDDSRKVIIWHFFSEESKALVVIVPGSDANKSRYLEGLPIFLPDGFDVILMDYEGFGTSPGQPSLQNCVDDGFVVAEYALTQHPKVFLFGASLGTPIVAKVASELTVAGCIFEGTFILHQEAELWLRQNGYDFSFLWHAANFYIYPQIPESFDILTNIQSVYAPKLFMHSIEDEVTPYEGGIQVFEIAPEPKEFWEMYGEHGKMIRLDTELYKSKVLGWIEKNL